MCPRACSPRTNNLHAGNISNKKGEFTAPPSCSQYISSACKQVNHYVSYWDKAYNDKWNFHKTKGSLLRVWIILQQTLCFGKSHQINLFGIFFHYQISAAYHSDCLIESLLFNSWPIPRISGASPLRSENRCLFCFQAAKVSVQKPGKGHQYQPLFYLKEQVTENCWFNEMNLIGAH